MQDLKEEQVNIVGEWVAITSWRDVKQDVWWALAPQYLTDWWGTKKTSRTEVVEDLASFLIDYIELMEVGDEELA